MKHRIILVTYVQILLGIAFSVKANPKKLQFAWYVMKILRINI